MGKIFVGDIGTEVRLYCMGDISTASAPVIAVKKPDGSVAEWPAVREDTALVYFTKGGDLSVPGDYLLQAKPNLESWQGRGETAVLRVHKEFAL